MGWTLGAPRPIPGAGIPRPLWPPWREVRATPLHRAPPGVPLPGLVLLTAAFAAEPASDTVVVEERAPRGPDPSTTSAAVTVLVPGPATPASADVASVVEGAAGTTVHRMGGLGDFAAVSLRGSSLRQVEVFLDGVPLNPDGAAVVNLAELPLGAFERIEVWRGNAPVRFGAAPLGGVINLVPGEAEGGRVSLAYGSWDTGRAHASAAGRRGNLDGQAFAEAFSTRGDLRYFDDNATLYNLTDDHFRTRDNNDKLQLSAVARGRLVVGDWRVTLADAPLWRDEGLPGSANLPASTARMRTGRNLAVARAEVCGPSWVGEVSAWHLRRDEALDDPDGELDGTPRLEHDQLDTVGVRASASWAPTAWLQPSASVGGRWEGVEVSDPKGGDDAPPRARLAGSVAIGADVRLFRERLTLSPVLQLSALDNRELGTTSTTQDGVSPGAEPFVGSVDPRLGVLVRPLPALALKANAGHYLRPPDLVELFGNHATLEGNSELRPETGWQFDVGARATLPDRAPVTGSAELGAFWLLSEDRIVWLQNSQRSFTPVNFGETWVQGVEAAVDLHVLGWLDQSASLTWQLSRNLTEGSRSANRELPRTPPLSIDEAVSVHWQERLRVGYRFTYTSPNYWDAANLYQSAPRTLHGAWVATRPTERWPTVSVDVLNLADTVTEVVPRNPADPDDPARVVTAVTDFAGYPLPGRTFMLNVSWNL